jgi:dephospho-CoA kinase
VALTGGIASGKTTVGRLLRAKSLTVIDYDELTRLVMSPGHDGFKAVISGFGPKFLRPDGSIDRVALGNLVFADPAQRARLEEMTHPLIRAEAQRQENESCGRNERIVVHEIPLLAESGRAGQFDEVVLVVASLERRIERLCAQGLTSDDAWARINAQATDSQREAIATITVNNNGTVAELEAQIDSLHRSLIRALDGLCES